jgi:hypothetical protein
LIDKFRYVYENFRKGKWGWSEIDKYWNKNQAETTYVTIQTNLGAQDDSRVKKLLKESTSYNIVNPDEVILQPTLDNKPVSFLTLFLSLVLRPWR